MSNAFFQESSQGTWKVTILNSTKERYTINANPDNYYLNVEMKGLRFKIIGQEIK
ncbi:hypothetical protein JCM31447_16580 [Fluviispira sanaruensis]|uniref:Uncharacterized protein n=1 Tax=Fluviispira sanaruensis TaxID=2493639 RepID=A0A4P2VUN6_FLUSA|nr:hypothetical protein JCM31447_16580 [Fluviispira sanaruensis]